MDNNGKEYNILKMIVWTIFIVQIILFFILFINKQEYHSDEIWSYGIANNQGSPNVFNRNGVRINFNKWIEGKVFHDYLTVQPNEKFDYKNVYDNTIMDNSQPFYMILLHTICSFFPDEFSYWYLVPIQIVAVFGGMYFFYKILEEIKLANVIIIGLMGMLAFSVGGINNSMFLRQYALYSTFCTALLYFHLKIYKRKTITIFDCSMLGIFVLLGTLTHVFYWVYAFLLGLIWFFMYSIKKEWMNLIKYTVSMFVGVIISLSFFPFIFQKTDNYLKNSSIILDYPQQWRILRSILIANIMGIYPSIYDSRLLFEIFAYFLFFTVVFIIPLLFLIRNEVWFNKLRLKIKWFYTRIKKIIVRYLKNYGFVLFVVFSECIIHISVFAKIVDCYNMADAAIRYLLGILPCAILVLGLLVELLSEMINIKQRIKNIIVIIIFVSLFSMSLLLYKPIFYSQTIQNGVNIRSIKNSNIIILLDKDWTLTCLTPYIDKSNKVFVTTYGDYNNYLEEMQSNDMESCFLIMDNSHTWFLNKFSQVSSDYFDEGNISVDEYLKVASEYVDEQLNKTQEDFIDSGVAEKCIEVGSETMNNFGYRIMSLN